MVEIAITDRDVKEGWSYVETDLLAEDRETVLTSFGAEHWQESGRDSEGSWTESDQNSDIRITVPKPGIYYLQFRSEEGAKNSTFASTNQTKIHVVIKHLRGTTTIFNWFGLILLVIGVVLNEIRNQTIITILLRLADSSD